MTAQLTDHHGAIDPAAFDADRPVRPHAPRSATKDLASNRLWGNVTRRSTSRRIVAVGIAHPFSRGSGIALIPSPDMPLD